MQVSYQAPFLHLEKGKWLFKHSVFPEQANPSPSCCHPERDTDLQQAVLENEWQWVFANSCHYRGMTKPLLQGLILAGLLQSVYKHYFIFMFTACALKNLFTIRNNFSLNKMWILEYFIPTGNISVVNSANSLQGIRNLLAISTS